MKFTLYILAAILTLAISLVSAKCSCEPADTECLAGCVARANKCITDCQTNVCYTHCIRDHWPGAGNSKSHWDVASPTKPSNNNNASSQPNTPTSSIVIGPAPTAATGQPVPTSGTPGHAPSSVNAGPPGSANGSATNYQIPKFMAVFAVLVAAYFLQ